MEGMVIDEDFWKERRVFVTGHSGFKGSWISFWLKQLGANVTGFSLAPVDKPNLFDVVHVASGMDSHIGDIRDLQQLEHVITEAQPEIVIHMAAQSLVRESYEDPVNTYTTNIIGTVNVLEAVRHVSSVKVLLNITSDKCYENEEWDRPYRETDPMGGHDPYSSSKGCAELVTSSYYRSFLNDINIGVATARAGNVIGGGDWARDRIVPDAISAFSNNKILEIRNPLATRPWQHVLEPIAGYLIVCQKLYKNPQQYSGPWNFGPDPEGVQPVSKLADEIVRNWSENANWQQDKDIHPHEAQNLILDSTKAHTQLGWSPIWSFDRTVKETVKWYKAWIAGEDINTTTSQQIARYQQELVNV